MPRTIGILFVVAVLLCASAAAFGQTCEYDTDWGVLTIVNNGSAVHGYYQHDSGRIKGRMIGKVIDGSWFQNSGSGYYFFRLYDGGFTGWWNYYGDRNWRDQWNGRVIRCW